jgi:hypothetical protein
MDAEEPSVPVGRTFDLGPREAWCWLTLGVGLLGAAETIGLAAIFHAVLPRPGACVLDLVVAVPTLGLQAAVASGLLGRIRVDAEYLTLRFGLLGGALVPRGEITRAEPFVQAALSPVGLGIDVRAGSRQATVSRGGSPVLYVRVFLDHPVPVRFSIWRRAAVDELVMSTGEPERLIAALA